MPALLTRIDTAPNSLAIASISASTAAASVTSRTRPTPPFADRGGAGFAGGGADHFRAGARQGVGDRRADAAAGAGDEGDFAREDCAHRWLPNPLDVIRPATPPPAPRSRACRRT